MTVKRITDSSYVVTQRLLQGAEVGPTEYAVVTRYTQGWAITVKALVDGSVVRQAEGFHQTLGEAIAEAQDDLYAVWFQAWREARRSEAERAVLANLGRSAFITLSGHGA